MGRYLHKDFYGGLSVCLSFLHQNFGQNAVDEYLRQVAKTCYKPLIEEIKQEGLSAWRRHLEKVFINEGGSFKIEEREKGFDLIVEVCPAISHIKKRNYPLYFRYCMHTKIVNDEIAKRTGIYTKTEANMEKGSCIQTFREGFL